MSAIPVLARNHFTVLPALNYYPAQDFGNSFWSGTNMTLGPGNTFFETSANGTHRVRNSANIVRAAAVKSFRWQADIELYGRTFFRTQIFDGASGSQAAADFNFQKGLAVNQFTTGSWVSCASNMVNIPGSNLYRCTIDFVTDGSTTNFNPIAIGLYSDGGTTSSYVGDPTKGGSFRNPYLFETDSSLPLSFQTSTKPYFSGQYGTTLNVSTPGSYVQSSTFTQGISYVQSAAFKLSGFPGNIDYKWHWPDDGSGNAKAFYITIFGDYQTGFTPPGTVTSKQISGISSLQINFSHSLEGPRANFNVIHDTFLTSTTGSGGTRVAEVGVYSRISVPGATYVLSKTFIGNTTISGINWYVAVDTGASPPFYMFMPNDQADVNGATIDYLAMINYLVSQGKFTSAVWFNGLASGAEAIQGAGRLQFSQYSVTYS